MLVVTLVCALMLAMVVLPWCYSIAAGTAVVNVVVAADKRCILLLTENAQKMHRKNVYRRRTVRSGSALYVQDV